jgi:hypothetical protein
MYRTLLLMAWLLPLWPVGLVRAAAPVAFNDYAPGILTHPNATTYGPGQEGPLKDIETGLPLSIRVSVLGTNLVASGVQGAPNEGTPGHWIFDGYIDFGGSESPALEMNGTTNQLVYTFTGLDPDAEYNFQGTAVRGHFNYTNRWSVFELVGAESAVIRATPGILTSTNSNDLHPGQIAINTGDNNRGDVAWWEHIRPGADGSFSVVSQKYLGSVPGGSSAGSVGYAMIAWRLEALAEYSGRTSSRVKIPNLELPSVEGLSNVFVIVFENHDWSTIQGSDHCPYINEALIPKSSYAERYYSPPGIHPSEPNYLWMVAGTNFNIRNDDPPSLNRQTSTNTLFHQLDAAGISWKSYQEDISGTTIPEKNAGNYVPRHNPAIFFDTLRTNLQYATNHYRPFTELAKDLVNKTAPRFCFISPNLTNDMHNLATGSSSTRRQGDNWLSRELPKILASEAYTHGGVVFIVWDEGSDDGDGPMGLIALSTRARGGGYHNRHFYTHSSLLRTLQDIFQTRPYLGDARYAESLADLFLRLSITSATHDASGVHIQVENSLPGRTYRLQVGTDLENGDWLDVANAVAGGGVLTLSDETMRPDGPKFYRVLSDP